MSLFYHIFVKCPIIMTPAQQLPLQGNPFASVHGMLDLQDPHSCGPKSNGTIVHIKM